MATLSSILSWEIQWTEEPGELPSMGSDTTEHICMHSSAQVPTAEYHGPGG